MSDGVERCWIYNIQNVFVNSFQLMFYKTLRCSLASPYGDVHTVPDKFLLRCKSCSGTVWTGINILLRRRNCSEAFPVWTEALSVMQFATLPFDLKRLFTKTRFRCNFCSDKSVHTWFGPFQKPIWYGTFHFQQRSGAVLFWSRNCFESSIPSVNRSPNRCTFCDVPFHYPVQCEHSLCLTLSVKNLNTDGMFIIMDVREGNLIFTRRKIDGE